MTPIVLKDDFENIADILAGSTESTDAYVPTIACAGIGGAACKESCICGCKNEPKIDLATKPEIQLPPVEVIHFHRGKQY